MSIIPKCSTEIRFLQPQYYEGHSEMIWTHLICRKYIIFGRMNTQQLLAQHIPLLGLHRRYLIRTFRMVSRSHSLGVLLYHSCSAVCAVFLVTAGTLYPVEQCCAQVLSLQGLQVTETNI